MADKLDEVFDFLGVFESSFPKSSQPPVLLSVSLGEDRPGIKLDVTMDSLDLSAERADLLSTCESRFGEISGFRKAGHLLQSAHGSALRYVGLSMQRGCNSYLNAYLSCPRVFVERERYPNPSAPAHKFCVDVLRRSEALEMDMYGLPGDRRTVSSDWPDIYACCLAHQLLCEADSSSLRGLSSSMMKAVTKAAAVTRCCYLPGFPEDADDISMFALSTANSGDELEPSMIQRLLGAQSASGGFLERSCNMERTPMRQ